MPADRMADDAISGRAAGAVANPVKLHRKRWVLLAGLAGGATVWGLSPWMTGVREPFDSGGWYYPVALCLAGGLASLPSPRHWWLATPAVFVGEHLYAAAAYPDIRPWLLFGILINLVVPTWWPAAVGAASVFVANGLLGRRAGGPGGSPSAG